MLRALYSPRQVQEQMTWFWLNHFSVFQNKANIRAMVGDYESRYGLASIEALSIKRQRMLQANCRVYDLINFATEIASHHAPPMAASRLQAWLGATITEEFDLENTANDVPEFVDVFTDVGGRTGVHRN